MTKKLPVVGKPTLAPNAASRAQAQRGLTAKPVAANASRPEFPTRSDLYRKASLLGGAALLASGIASADGTTAAKKPAPAPPAQSQAARPVQPPEPPVDLAALADGSVDGKALDKAAPKFKVYREGGGIGPVEEMWDPGEVEAYISYQFAKNGKLAIKSSYTLNFDGQSLALDGFDADKNIGYAYVDKLHGDRDVWNKSVRAKLDQWAKDKKVAILLLEVAKVPDGPTLKGKIIKFLNGLKKTPPGTGPLS